jgi:hypothetical protein
MMHEVDLLFPALVLKAHESPVPFLGNIKTKVSRQPFAWSGVHFPYHPLVWNPLKNFRVDAAKAEREFNDAADIAVAVAACWRCPPPGEPVQGRQCLVYRTWRGRLDANFMKDIQHGIAFK